MSRLTVSLLLAASAALAGCAALLPGDRELVQVVQQNRYCNTKRPKAALHFFPTPEAFGAWIDERDIRGLRSGAASLRGVLVLEMGKRPTAGYRLELIEGESRIEEGMLTMAFRWAAPEPDDQVAQVLVSPCVVIPPPKGEYHMVRVVDQSGDLRARLTLD